MDKILFLTRNQFYDFNHDDMQSGDLDESQLEYLGLTDISNKVNPYTLIEKDPFGFYFPYSDSKLPLLKMTTQQCADTLFDEMRELSGLFSCYGDYKKIINLLIDNFQHRGNMQQITSLLNQAYRERILKQSSQESPCNIIKKIINKYFIYDKKNIGGYDFITEVKRELHRSSLTKFNGFFDRVNGLGISVHDIYAQRISLHRIDIFENSWAAKITFEAEDHFGLDKKDITNDFYRRFRFFRIWFVLQRYYQFGYKPFLHRFSTIITIKG